jgi:hypothetical protein
VRRPAPLPEPLRERSFSVGEARALGVGQSRLLQPDLQRPFHGVRSISLPETVADRVAAYRHRLRPGDRFSHVTAALLWGAPLPRGLPDQLHVTAATPRNAPRGKGVRGHEDAHGSVLRGAWPVSAPARTFVELAQILTPNDLVAVGDHLVLDPEVLDPRDPRPHITLADLRAEVAAHRGRGARRARTAIALVRVGAESRPETLLRLAIIAAGLPEPEVNPTAYDDRGRRLGRVDLAYPDWRIGIEYDGEYHRTPEQFEKDGARLERFHLAGWRTIHVRSRGLFAERPATLARIHRALGDAGASLPRPRL